MEAKKWKSPFPSKQHHHPHHHQQCEKQPNVQVKPDSHGFAERLTNALFHHLMLLYRSDSNFYVLGATGNVYIINLSINPSCTCPDRVTPCKHILFVLIKVLGVPFNDPALTRKTLKPSHVEKLHATPSSPKALASNTLRERFHQVLFLKKELGIWLKPCIGVELGATCPICLEDMRTSSGDRIVACEICKIPIHEECLMTWKRTTNQKKGLSKCVTCRSQLEDGKYETYFNLSDHV